MMLGKKPSTGLVLCVSMVVWFLFSLLFAFLFKQASAILFPEVDVLFWLFGWGIFLATLPILLILFAKKELEVDLKKERVHNLVLGLSTPFVGLGIGCVWYAISLPPILQGIGAVTLILFVFYRFNAFITEQANAND